MRRVAREFQTDLFCAARALRRSRVFVVVAVLTLALGIGLNTAVFSVVNSIVFRPLPVRDPDRLVVSSASGLRSVPPQPDWVRWFSERLQHWLLAPSPSVRLAQWFLGA